MHENRFDLIYKLLWLFVIRQYIFLPPEYTQKLAKPGGIKPNEWILFHFAVLAEQIGLISLEVHNILLENPNRSMARRFLKTALEPKMYHNSDIESIITKMLNLFITVFKAQIEGLVLS
jgi:hypothetical protein